MKLMQQHALLAIEKIMIMVFIVLMMILMLVTVVITKKIHQN